MEANFGAFGGSQFYVNIGTIFVASPLWASVSRGFPSSTKKRQDDKGRP